MSSANAAVVHQYARTGRTTPAHTIYAKGIRSAGDSSVAMSSVATAAAVAAVCAMPWA